ncbi:hypothetical protein PIPA1_09520 [Pelosinus sp. IPA-1]|nr:hypothetical protein PIPA1_09520 [Pelosinus sp. IPA-1]
MEPDFCLLVLRTYRYKSHFIRYITKLQKRLETIGPALDDYRHNSPVRSSGHADRWLSIYTGHRA